jgi:hypothetical protein
MPRHFMPTQDFIWDADGAHVNVYPLITKVLQEHRDRK